MRNMTRVVIMVLFFSGIIACAEYTTGEEPSLIMRSGEVTMVTGEAAVKRAGSDVWMKALPGVSLSQDDIIKTTGQANIDVEFNKNDGRYFKIRLLGDSQLGLTTLEKNNADKTEQILMDLMVGEVLIRTDKIDTKSKFRVRTPTAMVGVRGTRFGVRYASPTE